MDQPAVTPPAVQAPPRMPTEFYPGPAPVKPMSRRARREAEYESDSDSEDSDDECRGSRKMLMAVALAVAVVLIIVILYYMFAPRTLSRSLVRCGWTVYLMKGCHFCHKQMKLLPGFDRYILCDNGAQIAGYTSAPPMSCSDIKSYPFWYNTRTGESRVGFQDNTALAKMAQW